mmetsp:Transcript_50894/g.115618  ORF Transcript_50894/g.115618 Transcript_50894/m.115618 type:complete len:200 (-) Transcript_50894:76-675(-)
MMFGCRRICCSRIRISISFSNICMTVLYCSCTLVLSMILHANSRLAGPRSRHRRTSEVDPMPSTSKSSYLSSKDPFCSCGDAPLRKDATRGWLIVLLLERPPPLRPVVAPGAPAARCAEPFGTSKGRAGAALAIAGLFCAFAWPKLPAGVTGSRPWKQGHISSTFPMFLGRRAMRCAGSTSGFWKLHSMSYKRTAASNR